MTYQFPVIAPPALRRRSHASLVALFALALAVVALNPVGFRGGGGDDWQYLTAARCWAAHGSCLPNTHWGTRLPLIVPMAGALALFGDGRLAVSLVPLGYALAALGLLHAIVARAFGARAALLAGALLLLSPVFATAMLQPNSDIPELAFQLAAIGLLLRLERDDRRNALAAGVAAAFALAMRETSLPFIVTIGAMLAIARRQFALRWFAGGVAVPLAIECAGYALRTGHPLYRFSLAMAHNLIPSTELRPGVDLSAMPLFNPVFIGGWRPAAGIDVHWGVNAALNLLAGAQAGPLLVAGAILALVGGAALRRRLRPAALLAAAIFVALTYGLAIDPKPRMFLLPLAVAATTAAAAAVRLRGWRRALAATLLAGVAASGLFFIARTPNSLGAEHHAAALLARAPGDIAVDSWTRRSLSLAPAVAALPPDPPDARYRLALVIGGCRDGVIEARDVPAPRRVVASWSSDSRASTTPPRWMAHDRVLADTGMPVALCLFKRTPPRR